MPTTPPFIKDRAIVAMADALRSPSLLERLQRVKLAKSCMGLQPLLKDCFQMAESHAALVDALEECIACLGDVVRSGHASPDDIAAYQAAKDALAQERSAKP